MSITSPGLPTRAPGATNGARTREVKSSPVVIQINLFHVVALVRSDPPKWWGQHSDYTTLHISTGPEADWSLERVGPFNAVGPLVKAVLLSAALLLTGCAMEVETPREPPPTNYRPAVASGIGCVVLLTFNERLHIGSGNQAHLVPQGLDLSSPVV